MHQYVCWKHYFFQNRLRRNTHKKTDNKKYTPQSSNIITAEHMKEPRDSKTIDQAEQQQKKDAQQKQKEHDKAKLLMTEEEKGIEMFNI